MSTINFICEATGYPSDLLTISWSVQTLNDRINITNITSGNQTTSVLTIHSAQLSDTSIYTCMILLDQLVRNILYNVTVGMCIHMSMNKRFICIIHIYLCTCMIESTCLITRINLSDALGFCLFCMKINAL